MYPVDDEPRGLGRRDAAGGDAGELVGDRTSASTVPFPDPPPVVESRVHGIEAVAGQVVVEGDGLCARIGGVGCSSVGVIWGGGRGRDSLMLMEHDTKPAESSPKVGDSFYREILEDGGGTGFVAASCSKASACGD